MPRTGTRRVTHRSSSIRASLWFWPVVVVVAAFALALVLLLVRPPHGSGLARLAWPGSRSSASSLLQTVATAVMTAASLTFSLTVVALQLASQQFSPRLLRSFARDTVVQATMGLLIATFVVATTALRGLDERPLPVLAVLLTLVLGLASAVMLLVFTGHIVRRLRVDTMMAVVHRDTVRVLEDVYPPYGDDGDEPPEDLPGPSGGVLLPAWRSGFVRTVDPEALVEPARAAGVLLLLGTRPGDTVVLGSPLASVVTLDAVPGADEGQDALLQALRDAVSLGPERTEEQDVAFGLRQLVDIAVKAMSPAVNDPTTAAEAVSYAADLLVRLLGRRLGAQAHRDTDGTVRVVSVDRDLRYYLDLTCAQLRRYGRNDPVVLDALLRMLRDLAAAARDDGQREQVRWSAQLVLAELPDALLGSDQVFVRDLADRVELALRGDVEGAFRDRAGETRSI